MIRNFPKKIFTHTKGSVLLEVVVAMAIFALVAVSVVSLIINGSDTIQTGTEQLRAELLVQETMEGLRSVKDLAWNSLNETRVALLHNESDWYLVATTVPEIIGDFRRSIRLMDICRDVNNDIVTCPGLYTDIHSREISVIIEWDLMNGQTYSIQRDLNLTNWDSKNWNQTDWQDGSGQSIWSDPEMYDSDDGNIDALSTPGLVRLPTLGSGTTTNFYNWTFDNASEYSYDDTKIEVNLSVARLIGTNACLGTSTECDTLNDESSCNAQDGCSWDMADCSGSPSSCGSLSQVNCGNCGCDYAPGYCGGKNCQCWSWGGTESECRTGFTDCKYNESILLCHGNCTCDQGLSKELCGTHSCSWNDYVCSKSPDPCNQHSSGSDCIDCGCSWDSADCYGVSETCSFYNDDQTGCSAQGGCHWSENFPTDRPTISATTSAQVYGLLHWDGFIESSTKYSGEIYYQLSDDDGASWFYWNGASWTSATSSNYNTASSINDNILEFSTSSGKITFQAFLESNGSDRITLDNVQVMYVSDQSIVYVESGYFISSAFDTGATSSIQTVEWQETIPVCSPACTINIQLRVANDSGGSPGSWTEWYGSNGVSTYFTNADGEFVPIALNGYRWLQYRAELTGDINRTPSLTDISINYK